MRQLSNGARDLFDRAHDDALTPKELARVDTIRDARLSLEERLAEASGGDAKERIQSELVDLKGSKRYSKAQALVQRASSGVLCEESGGGSSSSKGKAEKKKRLPNQATKKPTRFLTTSMAVLIYLWVSFQQVQYKNCKRNYSILLVGDNKLQLLLKIK